MVARAETASTATVTVLMPPAVPTGEPPMNMSSRQRTDDPLVRFSWGTVAKPAVRVVMLWKKETCNLSKRLSSPMVRGLPYSSRKIRSPPPKISTRVVEMAILLWRVRPRKPFRPTRSTSHQTM